MVSCSMPLCMVLYVFTVPLEVSLSKHFTSNDKNVGCLLLLIDAATLLIRHEHGNFKGLWLNSFSTGNVWETQAS